MKIRDFLINTAKGAAIGVAMIIPGVSGGTLAVLMKVYDKMIDSISNLRKHFLESVKFLFPILLGAVLAFAAAYFPLKKALEYAPFPTMLLFAGLMAGSCPKLFADDRKNGFKKTDIIAILIPLIAVIAICFIPGLKEADLSSSMPWYQYILVAIIGVVASCALVVPGISGSMLLMIFGYYAPVLGLFSAVFKTPLHAIAVLACFAVGVVVGFFTIAKLMQILLKKFPRVTGWAIFGFVVGSVPAVIITFFNQYGAGILNALQISLGVVMFIVGAIGTLALTYYADKHISGEKYMDENESENATVETHMCEDGDTAQTHMNGETND